MRRKRDRNSDRADQFGPIRVFALGIVAAFAASGCAGMGGPLASTDQRPEEVVHEVEIAREAPKGIFSKIAEAGGFVEEQDPYRKLMAPPEARQDLERAKNAFEARDYAQAEKIAKKVADRYRNTTIEEDALFQVAEARFARGRLPAAQDGYDELIERFPNTQHINAASQRLFAIAKYWLGEPELITAGDIKQVNFEDPVATPRPEVKTKNTHPAPLPFLPNMLDRSKPIIDTPGRALQALRSVWLNDPTGPLADEAVMLSADYHHRRGNFTEAERFYRILRDEYPQSPYLQEAFILGSHVKLMSYQGPEYDGSSLLEAKQIKESAVQLFPGNKHRERLLSEIREAEAQAAARQWADVQYYRKKNNPKAVAFVTHALLTDYPNSKYAPAARRLFDSLPASARNLLPPLPGQPKPLRRAPALEPVPEPYTPGEGKAGRASLTPL